MSGVACVFSPAGELFDLFCRFRAHIVSGVLFLLWRLYSYRCLWQLRSRSSVTGEGDGDGDRAIKQERAASAQNMAGSMCANVWVCVSLYSMCGHADVGRNDVWVQDSNYNKKLLPSFPLQSLRLIPAMCAHRHTRHILGTWRSLNNERQVCNLSFTMAVEWGWWHGGEDPSIHHRDKVWVKRRISTPLPPLVIVRVTHRQVSHNQGGKIIIHQQANKQKTKKTQQGLTAAVGISLYVFMSKHPDLFIPLTSFVRFSGPHSTNSLSDVLSIPPLKKIIIKIIQMKSPWAKCKSASIWNCYCFTFRVNINKTRIEDMFGICTPYRYQHNPLCSLGY